MCAEIWHVYTFFPFLFFLSFLHFLISYSYFISSFLSFISFSRFSFPFLSFPFLSIFPSLYAFFLSFFLLRCYILMRSQDCSLSSHINHQFNVCNWFSEFAARDQETWISSTFSLRLYVPWTHVFMLFQYSWESPVNVFKCRMMRYTSVSVWQ